MFPLVHSLVFAACLVGIQPEVKPSADEAVAGLDSSASRPTVAQLISDLAASDYTTREQATAAMIERDDLTIAELEAAIDNPAHEPEQRARLRTIAWRRFCKTPRGAIGVSFGGAIALPLPRQQNVGPTFVISELHPGFPARDKAQLKVGDVILKIDGHDVETPTRNPVRPHIICREPGSVVRMEILRDNQVLDVPVELGSFDTLPAIRLGGRDILSEADLRDAWQLRCVTRVTANPKPIVAIHVPVPEAIAAADDSTLLLELSARERAAEGHWPGVVPGGQAREGDSTLTLGVLDGGGQWGANGVFVARPRPVDDEARLLQVVSALTRQREDKQLNLDELDRALRDKNLRPDVRRDVAVKREMIRVERDVLDVQIRRQREQLDLLRQQRRLRP